MSPATGLNSPLLPDNHKTEEKEKGASLSGAVFNVSTSIIGAGIMSIPATFKVLGVIPAFVLVMVIAWLTYISAELLMRFTHAGEATTYGGVMREAFGPVGSMAVQVCVVIANLGCLITYLIIMGDVLAGTVHEGSVHLGVLQEWFGIHWWNTRAFAMLFVVVFVMLPLVLFRRIESLKFSSAISVLLALVFVGISSGMAIYAIVQGNTKTPRWLPQIDDQASFFNLFTAVPVIVTAFTFHFNAHSIGFELRQPSAMMSAVKVSLVLCAAIYFATGIFGYLLFGESTMSDILVNFDQSSGTAIGALLNDIVRLSYAFHLMPVFPLVNFSMRGNIDEFLFPNKPALANDTTRFLSLTLSLLALIYVAAIAIPNIWYVFQFVGSTAAVSIAFIFPGAIVLR
ncbi:Amino acid transporter avt6c [Turnera subulata]|uniref:Amino acid transporter avt6c n=1 Tax=Turnera subulata TaxID=218843 RepID=A0A9Q0JBQ5_9ROSI|nr:Amino acid transporter avt6c [Turnera subulata]